MLVYYNLLDCVPFIQAVKNLLIPYKQQNLDIFKRSFSVSGIAKLRMMQKIEKDSFFVCFQKTFGFIQSFEKSTYRRTQHCFLSVCCSRRNPNKKPRNFQPRKQQKKFYVWTQIPFIYTPLLKTTRQVISADTKNQKITDQTPAQDTD